MTRKSVAGSTYPDDWKAIAKAVKDEAGWMCVRCGVAHDPPRHVLTVHHLNMDPSCSMWWNLAALCARCHLSIQGRVDLDRPWLMVEHSPWFKVYAGGFFAWKYLRRDATRAEVEADLDWFADIERRCFGTIEEGGR